MAELSVDIDATTKGAVSEVEKLGSALEDLDDAGNSSKNKGVDKLEKDLKSAEKQAKETGRAVEKGLVEGTDGAASKAGQAGQAAAQAFAGGFDDVGGSITEVAENAFAGLGPIGAAAGLVITGAISAALGGAADAQEKLNDAREAAVDLADQLYENNGTLPLTGQVQELFRILGRESKATGQLLSMVDQWADFGTVLDDIRAVADRTGRPLSELINALKPGDLEATTRELERVNEELERVNGIGLTPVWDEQRQSLETYKAELTATKRQQEDAKALNDAMGDTHGIEQLAAAFDNATKSASGYFDTAENGVQTFDWSTYLTDAEATLAAADEVKRKIVTLPSDIAAEAQRVFGEQGAQAAAQYISAYESASFADQGRFVAVARANGEAAGQSFAEGTKRKAMAGINTWVPPKMEVVAYVNDKAVRDYSPPMKKALIAYSAVAADKQTMWDKP